MKITIIISTIIIFSITFALAYLPQTPIPKNPQEENILVTYQENSDLKITSINKENNSKITTKLIDQNISDFDTFIEGDLHISYIKPFQNPPKLIYYKLSENKKEDVPLPNNFFPSSTTITKKQETFIGLIESPSINQKILILYKNQSNNWDIFSQISIPNLSIKTGKFKSQIDNSNNIHIFYGLTIFPQNTQVYHSIIYPNKTINTITIDSGIFPNQVSPISADLKNNTLNTIYRRGGNLGTSGLIYHSQQPHTTYPNNIDFGIDGDYKIINNTNYILLTDWGRFRLLSSIDLQNWQTIQIPNTFFVTKPSLQSKKTSSQKIYFSFKENNNLTLGKYFVQNNSIKTSLISTIQPRKTIIKIRTNLL